MEPLKVWESKFLCEYIKNGQNGLKAYQKARPGTKDSTAKSNAVRLLKRPEIQKALKQKKEQLSTSHGASKQELIDILESCMEKAAKDDNHAAVARYAQELSKLQGFYEPPAVQTTESHVIDHAKILREARKRSGLDVKSGKPVKAMVVDIEAGTPVP